MGGGLYRFVYPPKENQQRIVYDGNLDTLLSGLSWIITFGNYDDSKSNDELTLKAQESKLIITCGRASVWTHDILNKFGVKSRIVTSLTLDEWNSYDNGHTLIEVYRKDYNKWVVYDLDQNVYFERKGTPLSFFEFSNYSSSGSYEIKYISDDVGADISNFLTEDKKYNYAFFAESLTAFPKQWYKRAIQVPMIQDGDYYYFFNNNRSRIESYSDNYKYMRKDRFMERFY